MANPTFSSLLERTLGYQRMHELTITLQNSFDSGWLLESVTLSPGGLLRGHLLAQKLDILAAALRIVIAITV